MTRQTYILPVLSNPLCEHHLAVVASPLPLDRVKLVVHSMRVGKDPDVPSRDWTVVCAAEMPSDRVNEFIALLRERLDAGVAQMEEPVADVAP